MTTLVIADHDNNELKASTLSVVAAAQAVGGDIAVLVAGQGCAAVGEQAAKVAGVGKVLVCDDAAYANQLAENVTPLIQSIAGDYSHMMFSNTASGKNIMPRVAAKMDVAGISDITDVISEDTFVRPIYAGNAMLTVQSKDSCKLITVRTTAFEGVASEGGSASIDSIAAAETNGKVTWVGQELTKSDRPELTSASVVVSGGRGMQNGENFAMLDSVAEKLNAAVGASRAAVDAGFVPNDYQVGQTGKVVAPDLYIAVGISGAIQHLAGMKDSKVIVAINKDEEAPIFQVADYGLVADLFDAIPELDTALAAD